MTTPTRRSTDDPNSALMEANALLRMVIDENPNIILMKDWDGKFLLGNRALARLYGTTPEGLVGKDDGAFNPNAEQVEFFLNNVRDIMRQDKTQVVMEESTDAATGETLFYQSIKIPLTSPQGKKQILVIANDVSELKRTQRKLEESERRLRYVLDATGEGIWDWNIATGVVTHNRRWCQIAGLDDAYLQHPLEDFSALLHPDDKAQVIARLQACLAGGGRYQSEHRMCLNNGQSVWVEDRGDVVERDVQGQPLRMVGSFVDISARKAAQLEAERSSQLLRESVNSIAQGFTIYDEQDRLFLCNEAYKRIYETSRDLIVPGNTFETIVREGARKGQYNDANGNVEGWVTQRVKQHQEASGEVIEQRLSDGRWLLIVESRTPSGFIVGNRIDITARKAAEALVSEHSAQLEAIFALSPDGFVSFDAAHLIKYVSPAFTMMTGLTRAQVIGMSEAIFSNRLAALCLPEARFAGINGLRAEKRPDQADAKRHVIELAPRPGQPASQTRVLSLSLRESEEQGVSQILHLRDITIETEVDRLKSEFLSTAAHELRTPMASIYGFAELLVQQDLDDASRQEFLGIIFKQSELMASILNELLDLARIEARRGKDFVMQTVPIQQLVAEVVASYKLPVGRTPPTILAPDGALKCVIDAKKTSQALLNVLSNAYKYSQAPGTVAIQLGHQSGAVTIGVTDQGIGMTPAQTARVGERFYRADTSGKVPGTGLGMTIVSEIMALHHGSVTIHSEKGVGTTVTLQFPDVTMPVAESN
jgi:PAS domain S-box-containing protein